MVTGHCFTGLDDPQLLSMCPNHVQASQPQHNANGKISPTMTHLGRPDLELIDAIKRGDHRRSEHLLYSGCSAEVCDEWNRSALFWACVKGHRKICEILIAFGAKVDSKTVNGAIPLHAAAQRGSVGCTDLLVKRGSNVDEQTDEGDTPLHIASYHGHLPLVEYLLRHADPSIQNKRSLTPADEAQRRGHSNIVELLSRLRVHLPLERSRPYTPVVHVNGSEINNLSLRPNLLESVHQDIQRTRSAPTSIKGFNLPPSNHDLSRSQHHLNIDPQTEQSTTSHDHSAHKCCPCAVRLRREKEELLAKYEELEIRLAMVLNEQETKKSQTYANNM